MADFARETYRPNKAVPVEYASHPLLHFPVNMNAAMWEVGMLMTDYFANQAEIDRILREKAHIINCWNNGESIFWHLHWRTM